MLNYLQNISIKIQWLKWPSLLVAALGGIGFVLEIFYEFSTTHDQYLIPSLVVMLWALTMLAGITFFPTVPAVAANNASWWQRVKNRVHRLYCYLIMVAIMGSSLFVLSLTWKLSSV